MKVRGIKRALAFLYSCTAILVLAMLPLLSTITGGPLQADTASQTEAKKASDKLFREGKKAIRAGEYERALEIYRGLLSENDQNLQAHLGASLVNLKRLDFQLCFEHASRALKIAPNNARAHALAGLSMLRSGFVHNAIAALVEALKLDPKEPFAFGAAAEIDYYEGRPVEARLKAFYAHSLEPTEPDFLITLARASSRLEMFEEAAEAYGRFLDIAPKADGERRDYIKGLIHFYRKLAGLRVHQVSGPKATEVPFRLQRNRPYIKVRINGREANFIIDTGSGFTVISKESAKRLGVSELARGGKSQGFGGTGKFPIIYGLINNINFGTMKVSYVPCFIRPFHFTDDQPGEDRADGYIGLSILSHFITELDYKEKRMLLDRNLNRPPPAEAPSDVTVVPFRTTQNGLISIETELEGLHRINAILDSAASGTVISMAAVKRLNMHSNIIKGQTVQLIGAAGVAENVELLFIRNCRVADLNHNNVRAMVLDFGAINETSGFEQSGILGGDFMRQFRITIDFPRAQVMLQPHSNSAITR